MLKKKDFTNFERIGLFTVGIMFTAYGMITLYNLYTGN
jgi:hypothetical protein